MAFSQLIATARLGDDLVMFDTARNKYAALPGAFQASGGAGVGTELTADARAILASAGQPVDGAISQLTPGRIDLAPVSPVRSPPPIGLQHVIYFLQAGIDTAWQLARGRAGKLFQHQRSAFQPDLERISIEADRLERLAVWLPVSHRCLPKCMTAARYLSSRGLAVDLVFGVRTYPFEAHCWLEHAGHLLNDDPDYVRAFEPIAVARG